MHVCLAKQIPNNPQPHRIEVWVFTKPGPHCCLAQVPVSKLAVRVYNSRMGDCSVYHPGATPEIRTIWPNSGILPQDLKPSWVMPMVMRKLTMPTLPITA